MIGVVAESDLDGGDPRGVGVDPGLRRAGEAGVAEISAERVEVGGAVSERIGARGEAGGERRQHDEITPALTVLCICRMSDALQISRKSDSD